MDEITSRKNPVVQQLRRLADDREYRRETGLFLGQGHKLLAEALAAGVTPETVLYCGALPQLPPETRCVRAAESLLSYVSPMKSAPELVFSCPLPPLPPPPSGRVLLVEDVQDPGNVGTMCRTAAAFGFTGMLLAGACADPWGAKAIRASMGAVFRLRLWPRETGEALRLLAAEKLPIYAAALSDRAETAGRFAFPASFALAVGNEGHGLSEAVLSAAEKVVRIPMAAGAESLNAAAAAAVLMWETYRGRDAGV